MPGPCDNESPSLPLCDSKVRRRANVVRLNVGGSERETERERQRVGGFLRERVLRISRVDPRPEHREGARLRRPHHHHPRRHGTRDHFEELFGAAFEGPRKIIAPRKS